MRKKRALPSVPGLSADSARFMADLQKETDRGVALVGAAFLDEALEAMLRAFFADDSNCADSLLGTDRPLGTFSARTRAARCLGLLGPNMHCDLNTIRDIRNYFAHCHRQVSFDSPEVQGLCGSIKTGNSIATLMELRMSPRFRFILAVVLLTQQLLIRGLSLKHLATGKDFTGSG